MAVSSKNIFVGCSTGEGDFLSTDGGINWNSVNNGLQYGFIEVLAVWGNNIFVRVGNYGEIYLSTDNGSIWTNIDDRMPFGMSAFAIIPNGNGDTTGFVGTNSGVYRSTNNGSTWTAAGLVDSNITSLAVIGTDLFASTDTGVYRSTNLGITWISANSGLFAGNINNLTACGGNLFAEEADSRIKIFRSTDNGISWTPAINGLSHIPSTANTLACAGSNLFVGFLYAGIYRSTDNGTSWNDVNNGLTNAPVKELTVIGSTIFAGTGWNIYTSSNMGISWTPSELYGNGCSGFALVDTILFVSGELPSKFNLSTDKGITWTTPLNAGLPLIYFTCLTANGNNLFAGTKGVTPISGIPQGGVFHSTDDGASWNLAGLKNTVITAIASVGKNIYVGTDHGTVNISTDNGLTWSIILTVPYSISAIVNRDGDVFIGTWGGGALSSTNGGIKWNWVNIGLSGSAMYVSTFLVQRENVFMGTNSGVYILNSYGAGWTSVNSGLPNAVYALVVSDSIMYAGSYEGVWCRPLSEMITGNLINPPAAYTLYQNFPNPFNLTTVMSYSLPARSIVTLKVYDILGREVRTLVNESQNAYTHSVMFNASGLSSGVYLYRIIAGKFVDTKKFVLIK
jgi:photosystem II stability/assembly factor-like uncharacterized protein